MLPLKPVRCGMALLLLSLGACSNISEEECASGDWYSIGVNDGKSGLDHKKFSSYQKECAGHGFTADYGRYQQGYQQGLIFYCDFSHGEEHGRAGKDYNTVCTGPREQDFRAGYQRGIRWYQARHTMDSIGHDIDRLNRQISQNREHIYALNQQIAQEQNPNTRASLLYRTDQLRSELEQLSAQVGRLQVQFAQAEHAFAEVEAAQRR